ESRKRPGQSLFLGSLSCVRTPRASNERYDDLAISPGGGTGWHDQLPLRELECVHCGHRLAHHDPHHLAGHDNGVMPSSPQRPAPAPSALSGSNAEDLALYWEKLRRRLPESLAELQGPTQGAWRCRRTWLGPG